MIDIPIHNVISPPQWKGGNRYCGPAALAAITGFDTAITSKMIRKANRKQKVTGTHHFELAHALVGTGLRLSEQTLVIGQTFSQWWKETYADRADRVWLVDSGKHWRIVKRNQSVCSQQPTIGNWFDGPKNRARVKFVSEVQAEIRYDCGEPFWNGVKLPNTIMTRADAQRNQK